jgi:hypothetical protein
MPLEPYEELALAVIVSGIVTRDYAFLQSEWCSDLCELTRLPGDGHLIAQALRKHPELDLTGQMKTVADRFLQLARSAA